MALVSAIRNTHTNEVEHRRELADKLNETASKLNAGEVTLATSGTTTTLTDPNINKGSRVFLFPTTSVAASTITGTYVSAKSTGSATITHTANAGSRVFDYLVVG